MIVLFFDFFLILNRIMFNILTIFKIFLKRFRVNNKINENV